jgi:hypothetical protein
VVRDDDGTGGDVETAKEGVGTVAEKRGQPEMAAAAAAEAEAAQTQEAV